jgi:hypothetical protein
MVATSFARLTNGRVVIKYSAQLPVRLLLTSNVLVPKRRLRRNTSLVPRGELASQRHHLARSDQNQSWLRKRSNILDRGAMPADIDRTIAMWETVVNKYVEHRRSAVVANPAWPPTDLRLALYGLPGNVLVTGLLNVKMVKSCLLEKAWWDANIIGNRDLSQRQHQTDQFVIHSKIGVYALFFSMFEALLRQLLRVLKPGACNNAYDAFANVYTCLLGVVGLQRHVPLLDFARTLRNLIHNNGTYISRAGINERLAFNGQTYIFEHGRRVDFAYEELLFDIYDGALALTDDLIACQELKTMPVTLAA